MTIEVTDGNDGWPDHLVLTDLPRDDACFNEQLAELERFLAEASAGEDDTGMALLAELLWRVRERHRPTGSAGTD